ncbi:MAG TPA: PadR family transcriptional regulator [Acidimicrobiales bacterium]|nr:PadR family transcriptional regulator [Acidimicrobiales bacterium]
MASKERVQFFMPGELPLVVLALLDLRPMNGSELMTDLGRLFGPTYRASPGSVYPALNALADEKLIATDDRNSAKSWALTPSGRKVRAQRRRQLAAVESRTGARLGADGNLEPALERFVHQVLPLSGLVDPEQAQEILDRAAVDLKSLKETGDGNGN